MPEVAVIIGSASDAEIARPCLELLRTLEIDFSVFVSSAHRSPKRTEKIVAESEAAGAKIFICVAGMAAHLAGAVAARTMLPVIGVPVAGASLAGMDALFSTVQMPAGFPVATVALNGAKNAAWLAAQILALNNRVLADRVRAARAEMAKSVEKASRELEQKIKYPE